MNSHRVLGVSKLVFALIIVAVAATAAVGAYVTFQGTGSGIHRTTTGVSEKNNYFTLELSCGNGEISEAYEAYSKKQ